MHWNPLNKLEQLEEIRQASFTRPQVIFKHSTRCAISSMAKNRLDKAILPEGVEFHYLDLIQYRSISNEIAKSFGVDHESPQVLLIKEGTCIFDTSHSGISMTVLEEALH
ncbi:bacillithiol system redox-active protein YtxJ [Flavihumibacter sp. CACIAM 22H1]|uniref:bacillithiol system redox-active protein YtxJ n=1 Tax=Flavihumibacter sp. CACIAM 22H1 TaxID=1812911 RepID=UPI0007A901F0|nr:bacillithiol system redox-active protein YtxJ [Flavihumibacter sp. CACIAM 22H1]KYP16118.1 MAG: bacillithiol system protein YtxJ [Flavihumibacter sp. CACIAM 22H1]